MNRDALVHSVMRNIPNNWASVTAFVAPSQAGKTHFLVSCGHQIGATNRLTAVCGPFPATDLVDTSGFLRQLLTWRVRQGIRETSPEAADSLAHCASLSLFWQQVEPLLDRETLRSVVILVDDVDEVTLGQDNLYNLMARHRKFRGEWRGPAVCTSHPRRSLEAYGSTISIPSSSDLVALPGGADSFLVARTLRRGNAQMVEGGGSSLTRNSIMSRMCSDSALAMSETTELIISSLPDGPVACETIRQSVERIVIASDWVTKLLESVRACSRGARCSVPNA